MQTRFFDATIYRTTPGHGATTVGITFRPTPNMTEEDLRRLVLDLSWLALDVRLESMEAVEAQSSDERIHELEDKDELTFEEQLELAALNTVREREMRS